MIISVGVNNGRHDVSKHWEDVCREEWLFRGED